MVVSMINYNKLAKEILKDRLSVKHSIKWMDCCSNSNNEIYGYTDCCAIFIFNRNDNLLKELPEKTIDLDKFIEPEHIKSDIVKSITFERDYNNNIDYAIISTENYKVYANKKYFDFIEHFDYIKVSKSNEPIRVYDNDTIIAIILPIYRNN